MRVFSFHIFDTNLLYSTNNWWSAGQAQHAFIGTEVQGFSSLRGQFRSRVYQMLFTMGIRLRRGLWPTTQGNILLRIAP